MKCDLTGLTLICLQENVRFWIENILMLTIKQKKLVFYLLLGRCTPLLNITLDMFPLYLAPYNTPLLADQSGNFYSRLTVL